MLSPSVENLVAQLTRLPGIGSRTAQRLAFHILQVPKGEAAALAEAHPTSLEGDTLTIEFPPEARFHRQQAEEQKNAGLLGDALYEVTGRRLELVFAEGAPRKPAEAEPSHPATEEEIVELVKSTFDATEVD